MRVIVLHPYHKFEAHRPFCSADIADFRGGAQKAEIITETGKAVI